MSTQTQNKASIETERLLIRPFTPEDYPHLKALHQHPDVAKTTSSGYSDDQKVQEELDEYQEEQARLGISQWAIFWKDASRFVGRTGLQFRVWDLSQGPQYEWRVAVHPDVWGQGIAPEAGNAIIHYGLETLKIERVVMSHWSYNEKSPILAQKLGFTYLYDTPVHGDQCPYYEIRKAKES
ncbi:MAG: GNAT family N-acetyltransferase [Vampirovibrio sp.]